MEENAVLEAKATLRYARISARKVKIVADLIRGKEVKVDAYIDKPVFIDNLLLVLNQMIKKR